MVLQHVSSLKKQPRIEGGGGAVCGPGGSIICHGRFPTSIAGVNLVMGCSKVLLHISELPSLTRKHMPLFFKAKFARFMVSLAAAQCLACLLKEYAK